MLDQQNMLRNIQKMQKDKEDLKRILDENQQQKYENEEYIKRMEYEINEKEKKLKNIIDELTRKSNLNEEQLLFLKSQIDKERRKSLADEQKIKKL